MDAEPDSSTRVFTLPEIGRAQPDLVPQPETRRSSDDLVSENFYWLSTAPETLEWDKSHLVHTPTKTFADYTALRSLPPVTLKIASTSAAGSTTVSLTNPGKSLAFAVRSNN